MKEKKINPINTQSKLELLNSHTFLHKCWNDSKKTSLTKSQIRKKHTRLAKIMLKRGFRHNTPLR